jgi:hypothetical protein
MASLTQHYTGNFESVFEQELNAIAGLPDADAFRRWSDAAISSQLTDDFFSVTLPNELSKNRASGPIWYGFLAAQVVLGSHVLFGTGTVAQLLMPASSGQKKAYDKYHLFPANFLKAGPYASLRDCRANFACLDYQTNIHIGDEDPKVYVARFRSECGDEAYSKVCAENALPEGFENMEYPDFLAARQRLMVAMIREAFGKL